ncbi:ATP-dependent helicase/nuclease subunit A [Siminovitchia terrae]|uniref:helicase-exonuclease AddAB subunit AddA n=1 Tax=Siminovitchia terrae TaxID=1914933 RepID=UPI001AFE5622|nr:helicase-exonuclease AddAB subunit AddA [Siminovitchia terrae]GIN93216.1 ATP-dependent helicase/nuclease subunit A [Siminovitchia terrae]
MKTDIPVKPEHAKWTDDQWKAIYAKDQDILVAAAAGSGKTAVLVERIIQRVIAETDPLDVDQLLVVTFTNAAAAEMRARIGEALTQAINERSESVHLRKQLGLLNRASISTLHSFCLDAVRKHYYMIDIDPHFRVADDNEIGLLRDEVLDDLFEEEYGKKNNDQFFELVDTFTGDRSDGELQELVLKLYDFSRSHPHPDRWLDALVNMYNIPEGTSIEDLPFTQILLSDIKLQLTGARQMLEEAYEMTKMPGGPAPRAANYLDDLEIVNRMIKATTESWEILHSEMNNWKFTRAKSCRGDDYDRKLLEDADALRKKAKGILEKIVKDVFAREAEGFLRDMRQMHPIYQALVQLVKLFSIRFTLEKKEKGIVDFADLEHFALHIFVDGESSENEIQPSEIALEYRNQFREVLVDEYQDVNMVQETILQLISADGEYDGNLFMVGDVKQSIYRFRLAEPNLFLAKYTRFDSDGINNGLRIDLSRNFRSRAEVLDGTNFLFKQFMGKSVGEIDYNKDAELVLGAGYPSDDVYPIEVVLIDQSEESDSESNLQEDGFNEEEIEQSRLEARFLAKKIREIVDGEKSVYDPKIGLHRPVQYKDIVILLRSLTWAQDIMDELKHEGIPVYANLSSGYFEATEVTVMMSLLKVVDNPDQDIPLAAVLRSPIVGLDEEALAQIRMNFRKGSFYEAVKKFVKMPGDASLERVREKLTPFIGQLNEWRSMARSGLLSSLIWQLYRDTGFYEFVGGLPGGKQRQANLRALYDRASQYEETSFRGLFRFLRFIERMQDRGKDLGAARALGEQEDVVRLMTIHSSKGLEFPIVFAAGLGRKFNMQDINSSYLFDKDFGFASKYIDSDKRISYPSLPQLALKRKKRMELAAEEMRVLYVALTRAKEKLYLIGIVKNLEKEIKKWSKGSLKGDWLLKDFDRASASTFMDWIGPAIIRHKDCNIADIADVFGEVSNHPSRWKVDIVPTSVLQSAAEEVERESDDWLETVKEGLSISIESPLKEKVFSRLNWSYPHLIASKRMSKQTVSELKRMAEIKDEASAVTLMGGSGRRTSPIFNKPKFLEKQSISPAERGTVMHAVMQHIPLDEAPSLMSVEHLLDDLIQKEILTLEQADAVSGEQIVHFFQSNLGRRILESPKTEREVPFTMGIKAKEVYPDWDGEDESVIVQGMIDCIVLEEDGAILVDYKTDAITNRFPGGFDQAKKVLEKRYQMQVHLYGQAIEQIWKKKVKEKYLYFFDGSHILKL